jgi:hypothetical protein
MDAAAVNTVLNDPVAQELLSDAIPARLAYTARDGTPRVVPVGIVWRDPDLVIATSTNAAKVPALQASPDIALTIDTNLPPQHVLLVRGAAAVEIVDGVPDDYLAGVHKIVDRGHRDEAWFEQFEEQVRVLYDRMALIRITPTWAKVLDFETRIPSNVEELAREKFGSPD